MAWWRFQLRAYLRVLAATLACVCPAYASSDPLSDLDAAFREAYSGAAERTLANLRSAVPLLVNSAGQIALYRPGIPEPDMFTMDSRLYTEASIIAHTPVALEAQLLPNGSKRLDAAKLDWLAKYEASLAQADTEVARRTDIPPDLKAAQHDILSKVQAAASQARRAEVIDRSTLDGLGAGVRQDIELNLKAAAISQLDQFRAQITKWKAAYPDLPWDRAVVVIIAGHQPRQKQLQHQFFDWLLHDDPGRQDRVVYAETLGRPPPIDQKPATDAMVLLSKVMLDKTLAASIFGDPLALQSDALGPSAEEVIGTWPAR